MQPTHASNTPTHTTFPAWAEQGYHQPRPTAEARAMPIQWGMPSTPGWPRPRGHGAVCDSGGFSKLQARKGPEWTPHPKVEGSWEVWRSQYQDYLKEHERSVLLKNMRIWEPNLSTACAPAKDSSVSMSNFLFLIPRAYWVLAHDSPFS